MIVFLDGGAESNSFLFQTPVATLVHAEGAFWHVEGETRERVENPVAWLESHARTHTLAGYLGFEFGYLTQGLKQETSLPQDNLLCVGIFEGFETEPRGLETDELDFGSVETPERSSYLKSVAAARSAIYRGDFFEVNYTGRFKGRSSSPLETLYSVLKERSSGQYFALIKTEGLELACVSPELFLDIRDSKVLTKPIKGTRRRGQNSEEDAQLIEELKNSEKDRAENIMIVDLMRNDLTPFSVPGSVVASRICDVETFAGVHHLVSSVESELLPGMHPMELFLAAFPPGSITGAPKLESMSWIDEHEYSPRGPYTGSAFASWPDGRLVSNVLIRCAWREPNKDQTLWTYGAGGAVVSDSVPDDEFTEALVKARVFTGLSHE